MNKTILLLSAAFLFASSQQSAKATPDMLKGFREYYAQSAPKVVEMTYQAKCDFCHPPKSKKTPYTYGSALKRFVKRNEAEARKKQSADLLKAYLDAGYKKTEDVGSIRGNPPHGPTFGEIIRSGRLPSWRPPPE